MSSSKVLILSILCCWNNVYGADELYDTNDSPADRLYQHPNECKDPSDGGIWAPLPLEANSANCGGKLCKYPQQWCSAKTDGNLPSPAVNCVDLPPDCQKVLQQDGGTTTTGGTTAAPAVVTTMQATTSNAVVVSSTRASTAASKAVTRSTAAGGVKAASSRSTASSGCKDNHESCCFWASRQQCNVNPKWMRTNCQQSCGTCGCQEAQFQTCQVKVNTAPCSSGNRVRVMLGGGPGLGARNPGATSTGAGSLGSSSGGSTGGQPSSVVTIPIGRKRRHFMP